MSDTPHDWLADAATDLHDSIERELRELQVRPDLADVIARARALDGDAVSERLHDVVLDDDDDDDDDAVERFIPGLDVFAAALRDDIEADVHTRTMHPATGRNTRVPTGRHTRVPAEHPRRRWGLAVVALAAAAIAAVGVTLSKGTPAYLDAGAGPVSQASKTVTQLVERDAWSQRTEPRRVVQPNPEPLTQLEPDPPLPPELEPAPQPAPGPTQARASLDELEAEAMAAWRAGELGRAESRLRQIIGRAGQGPKAELAYGDLFAVTKQRGGTAEQTRAWRQYLRQFPKGRFADDARAGLCMRASAAVASACWSDYLEMHPQGTHAERARRALTQPAPPEGAL